MKKRNLAVTLAVLLLALAGSAQAGPKAAGGLVPFKGTLEAQEQGRAEFPTLYVDAHGAGNATHLGAYTLSYQVEVDIPTGSAAASIKMVAANGDTILAEGPGQGFPTSDPDINRIVENYTVTGGTGRLAGATGSFAVLRVLNLATGVTSGTFAGTLTLR
jgi:hypothetical protein